MSRRTGDGSEQRLTGWSYLACYGFYVLILGLCFVGFWMWRGTAEVVSGTVYRKADAQDAVYLVSTTLVGLVLFMLAIFGEPYLRDGLEHPHPLDRRRAPLRRVAERFARLALPLVGSLFLALVIQEWALSHAAANAFGPPSRPPAGAVRPAASPGAGTASAGAGAAAGPPAPAPGTQDRGLQGPGPWVAGAALAITGTVILAATKRPSS
jgi:hypothetical protein